MKISSEKVLSKMEELVQKAKMASTIEQQASYISTIQTLCELLVEEEPVSLQAQPLEITGKLERNPSGLESVKEQPINMGDANGSSLLDF